MFLLRFDTVTDYIGLVKHQLTDIDPVHTKEYLSWTKVN